MFHRNVRRPQAGEAGERHKCGGLALHRQGDSRYSRALGRGSTSSQVGVLSLPRLGLHTAGVTFLKSTRPGSRRDECESLSGALKRSFGCWLVVEVVMIALWTIHAAGA